MAAAAAATIEASTAPAWAAANAAGYTAIDGAYAYKASRAAEMENERQTARICIEILGADIIATINELIKDKYGKS